MLEGVRELDAVHLRLATWEGPESFEEVVDPAVVSLPLLDDATRRDQGFLLSDLHRALELGHSLYHNANAEDPEPVAMDLSLEV